MEYKFKASTKGSGDFTGGLTSASEISTTTIQSTAFQSATFPGFLCDVCGFYADSIITINSVNSCWACYSAKYRSASDMTQLKPLVERWVREALHEYFDMDA